MRGSLRIGQVWGTEIRLHVSLLLLIPYALFTFEPRGAVDTARVFLLIIVIFGCVGLHELGHTLAARLYGIPVKSIVLWVMGGVANLSARPEKVFPNIVISAAGPLTNLLLFLGLLVLIVGERVLSTLPSMQNLNQFFDSLALFPFLVSLAIANASLALFNLIPIFPLDGGQIARGLLTLLVGEKWADTLMLLVSLPLGLGLLIFGIARRDGIVLVTAVILLLASVSLNMPLYNGLSMAWLFLVDRGGFYLKQGDYDRAHEAFTRSIQRAPERGGAYISRAVTLMNLEEWAKARADVNRALHIDPQNFVAWTMLGELLTTEGQYDAALQAYQRATALNETWPLAYVDRGSLYQQTGRCAEALAEMNRAVELSGGGVVYSLLRSILRFEMGDTTGAQADVETALRYAPNWMLTYPEIFLENFRGHLGWVLFYYEQAVRRTPRAYQAYQGRADALRINGRLEWAAADYTRAIALARRPAELYLGRGRTYIGLQRVEDARKDLLQVTKLAQQSHLVRQAAALLRSLDASTSA